MIFLDGFSTVVPDDANTVTAKEFSQRLMIPEESAVFKIWAKEFLFGIP
jgi:RNase P/RNase MRP subunit p29